jgi:hypothetical protein
VTTLRLIFRVVIRALPMQAGALPNSQPPTPGAWPLSVVPALYSHFRLPSVWQQTEAITKRSTPRVMGLRVALAHIAEKFFGIKRGFDFLPHRPLARKHALAGSDVEAFVSCELTMYGGKGLARTHLVPAAVSCYIL